MCKPLLTPKFETKVIRIRIRINLDPDVRRISVPKSWIHSSASFRLWPWQRKQKKKEKRQWQTGYSPRPPTSPYRSQSLHAGWPPVSSSIFQVLLKSVQWFCRCGWSEIALPHYFGHWLIQQLVLYRTSRDSMVWLLRAEG